MKLRNKHSGFTLVELLIVIVVIGILSAMMMLSSTEAVSSSQAAKIISDMRNLKTATLAWYMDNIDKIKVLKNGWFVYEGFGSTTGIHINELIHAHPEYIKQYLGSGNNNMILNNESNGNTKTAGEFSIMGEKSTKWYVKYKITSNNQARNTSLESKLASRASSVGLYNKDNDDPANIYTGGKDDKDEIYMKILDLTE